MAYLRLAYGSDNWPFVARFLGANLDLLDVLRDLPTRVKGTFSGMVGLSLSGQRDPDDGTDHLVATILTALPPLEALDHLDRLDCDWWLTQAATAGGRLVVTVDSTYGV